MTNPEDARATADRKTDRGRVEFVSLRSRGIPVDALLRVLPQEPVVLDEMRVTPSERWRNRDTVGRAKQALAKAKSGQRLADRDVERLQQRLLSMERQAQLAGRESEGRPLVEALAEVRRSQVVDTALDLLARAKRGRQLDEREVVRVQRRLLGMERQDATVGNESQGMQLAAALGEVRRSQLVADAKTVLARATAGGRVDDRRVGRMQQRLLGMEQQDELLGKESEGRQLAAALAEARRSRLVADAMATLSRMKQGRHLPDAQLRTLQRRLVEMEKQDELFGRESEGLRLAVALAEARR